MSIKATVRFHYIPTRKAKMNNSDNTKCWRGFTAGGNVKWTSHSGKRFGNLLKN